MKPVRFAYHAPASLDDALTLTGQLGDDATILAGGQSLVPMMNLRLVQPEAIVDLNRIDELDYVRRDGDHLAIGAMTRTRAATGSPEVARDAPLLAEALPQVAYPAVRARGTVGGSIAHADPAAEAPCVLVAADATVVLAAEGGRRREVAAAEFFLGPYWTAREPEELLVETRLPVPPPGTVTAFTEFARKQGDFALVLVAVTLAVRDGRCASARIAIGGATPAPVRATAAEEALAGATLEPAAFAQAAAAAADSVEPTGDAHASSGYRRRLVAVEVERALGLAAARAADANGQEVAHG